MDTARELWNEKIDSLRDEITKAMEDESFTSLKGEIDILKDIKKSIEYCIDTEKGTGSHDAKGSDKQAPSVKNTGTVQHKKQIEEPTQTVKRQVKSEQPVKQKQQAPQKKEPEHERISIHEKIDHFQKHIDAQKAEQTYAPKRKRNEISI